MFTKSLLAFFTAMLTGITLQTPKKAWLTVGISAMLGLIARQTFSPKLPELMVVGLAAFIVGVTAEIFARVQKQPVTVYVVSGIIPLVPGTTAYSAMLAFLERQYDTGLFMGFRALLLASYLAGGLAIASLVMRYLRLTLKYTGKQKFFRK